MSFWNYYHRNPSPWTPPKEEKKCSRCLTAWADKPSKMCYWCGQIESNKVEKCSACGKTSCNCPW